MHARWVTGRGGLLEGYAVLGDALEAGLPDESDIARIRCLQTPGEKGGDGIAADYRVSAMMRVGWRVRT